MSRRFAASIAALVAVATLTAVAVAQHGSMKGMSMPMGKTVTVTGILVDTKCYSMNSANTGQDHQTPMGETKMCAKACATMGLPVGLRTAKGELYILIAPVPAFTEHMAETARVTGTKVYGGGSIRPEKVEVKDATGKWIELNIKTMM